MATDAARAGGVTRFALGGIPVSRPRGPGRQARAGAGTTGVPGGGRMVVVLMGVSGSGKTTVGERLAADLGWRFLDADDFHPPSNVERMRRGVPLTDEDRRPWLEALRQAVAAACGKGEDVVLACSALKRAYQDYLRQDVPECVEYVYLRGSEELIRQRLAARKGHFMNPELLESQFAALEPPDDALQVDVAPPPEVIAAEIQSRLGLSRGANGPKADGPSP